MLEYVYLYLQSCHGLVIFIIFVITVSIVCCTLNTKPVKGLILEEINLHFVEIMIWNNKQIFA